MWRYFEMLPVKKEKNIVSLGEGMTPIIPLNKLASRFNLTSLLMKDESKNPVGSFKARGMSAAVSKMKEFGIDKCIIPTAGNAGGALAAYCAEANIQCTVVMPEDAPEVFKKQCNHYNAELILVPGLIDNCAKKVEEIKKQKDCFNVSTMKEPYRLEGKKTMGYEIAEQLDWELPDIIICPVGGGTGLIGIWKAFKELIELGWINEKLPRMIAVQTANCAPLFASYKDFNWKENFLPKPSIAYGLAVPYPFAMDLMRNVIKESKGEVITVTDDEINDAVKEIEKAENILISPEGAATLKAVAHLLDKKFVSSKDKVLLLNTGSDYKYLEGLYEQV
jgi:threonine synthase